MRHDSLLISFQPYSLTIDQSEDVVEDEVAPISIRHKLECLAVVHRPLLLVDLYLWQRQ